MIIGMYGKDGSAVVLPLDDLLNATGLTKYTISQALEGKGKIKNYTVVKMPNNTVIRPPEKEWNLKIQI